MGGEWPKEHLPGRYCKLWGLGRNSCPRRALPSLQPSSCPRPELEHRCHTVPGPALGCSRPSRDGGLHPVPTAKELEGGNSTACHANLLPFFFFFCSLWMKLLLAMATLKSCTAKFQKKKQKMLISQGIPEDRQNHCRAGNPASKQKQITKAETNIFSLSKRK